VHPATYAEQLVEWLKENEGKSWGWVTFQRITLTSPPDKWPPTIRLEYTVDGEHRVDEGPELTITPDWSLYAASEFWIGVTLAHFDEQGLIPLTPEEQAALDAQR
jgi:hypothetical protein